MAPETTRYGRLLRDVHRPELTLNQIITSNELLDAMRDQWAPAEDPVFQLTPPEFDDVARHEYAALGSPVVNLTSFWDVYLDLLQAICRDQGPLDVANVPQSEANVDSEHARTQEDPPMALLPGLRQLRMGEEAAGPQAAVYVGGLGVPPELYGYDGSPANSSNEDWEVDEEEEEVDGGGEPELAAVLTDFRDDV